MIPQWLAAELDAVSGSTGYEIGYQFSTGGALSPVRRYHVKMPTFTVKAVCAGCNSGWMASLEGNTRAVLTSVVRGEAVRLEPASLVQIAQWAAKMVAMLDHYEKNVLDVTGHDLIVIWRDGRPPAHWLVRLGYRPTPDPVMEILWSDSAAWAAGGDPDERARGFIATMALGHLAVAVAGGPAWANPERWSTTTSRFALLAWPPVGAITWPPVGQRIDDRQALRDFHESFFVRIVNDGFPRPNPV